MLKTKDIIEYVNKFQYEFSGFERVPGFTKKSIKEYIFSHESIFSEFNRSINLPAYHLRCNKCKTFLCIAIHVLDIDSLYFIFEDKIKYNIANSLTCKDIVISHIVV